MERFTIANNVRCTLFNSALAGDSTVVVANATAPFNNPPSPGGSGYPGLVTLTDSLVNPTRFEIITYTDVTVNGNGTRTLTGCLRGRDGTTAQAWSAGAVVYCAPTRSLLNPANVALTDRTNFFMFGLEAPQLIRSDIGLASVQARVGNQSVVFDVSRYHTLPLAVLNFKPFSEPGIWITTQGLSQWSATDVTLIVVGQQVPYAEGNNAYVNISINGYPEYFQANYGKTILVRLHLFGGGLGFQTSFRELDGDPFGFHPDTLNVPAGP